MLSNIWSEATRIVIKLGTQVVIDPDGELATDRLENLAQQCALLSASRKQLLLVSSGAVGLGRKSLSIPLDQRLSLVEKQACAAVGQAALMEYYRGLFQKFALSTAQILLTAEDFSQRRRYLTLRSTLEKLLEFGTLPIINENDTVSTMELADGVYSKSFGDNDKLSALVAGKLDADLLVILTNVDGIYTQDPRREKAAVRIEVIESFQELASIRSEGVSEGGRGGMTSKIEAARIASISGVHTWITSGLTDNPLENPASPSNNGTLVRARPSLPKRRTWIGFASGVQGCVVINSGACEALTRGGGSLLPIGIVSIEGEFPTGQVVSVQDENGREVGRGISNFSAAQLQQIRGIHSEETRLVLGGSFPQEAIHRDNLVIFGFEPESPNSQIPQDEGES